ncbi:MAG: glycosyltransferase [Dickeya sp.]|uniref:Glycosyl transferase group 1 n=1 Tax=Dickeya zeae (strain Ech586) TaxID=590409 RepID=D2BSE2_DICZ5|nr:glycosyltransferase [Dickeya parazeae]ACZ75561.1 glycosyl transferase group 1 [Dickeya parazeae Ech586]PXW46881.1 glycosyltransferase involved in cell wall biosynthesis [Erwinia sp. AG740]
MKIYFNTYSAAFQCPGGGEIQLLKSKEALERRGHEVILFNQWEHSLEDADVLHHFSVQGGSYNICAYAHNHKIPLVVSPILWLGEHISQYPMGEIGFALSLADVICPNSIAEVERFFPHFDVPEDRYHVTHNGVDSTFFERVSPELFLSRFGIDKTFVLCVGNIENRKNQSALLEAANILGVHVILIGNIRDAEYYNDLERRFQGGFSYLGYLEHDSDMLRSAYSACRAFALPSLLETPGLAALEAAAAGVPLVITQEGCTEEYFGSKAFYVDPNSSEDIAAKLALAMEQDRERSELVERVRQFSWDRVAEELEQAYLKALSTKSHH